MSKVNDKKAKADKAKPTGGASSYKTAQAMNKPAAGPFSKKPAANQSGRKGA
jgi:hypothetical protein